MKTTLSLVIVTFLFAGCATTTNSNPIVQTATVLADKDAEPIEIPADLLAPCHNVIPKVAGKEPKDLRETIRILAGYLAECANSKEGLAAVVQQAFKIGPDGKPVK